MAKLMMTALLGVAMAVPVCLFALDALASRSP